MDNDRDLLLISVFTFFTVTLWIFFELVKTAKTTTISQTTQQIIVPFTPIIDTDTLEVVRQKKVY